MKSAINYQRALVPLQELGEESLNRLYEKYGCPDAPLQMEIALGDRKCQGMGILEDLFAKGTLCPHLQHIARNGGILQKQALGKLLHLSGSELLSESKISRTKIAHSVARQINLVRSRSGGRLISPRRVREAMTGYGI